ncbi:hypothetical protein MBLNU230_g2380t1 [Neophaeotheca triangularis]
MGLAGVLFIAWRIWQIVLAIPIVGMLAYFVDGYVSQNALTPRFILVLFITSVIALAWAVFTLILYFRARHDAIFVALVDLGIFGALIAGVYYLRGVTDTSCSNFTAGDLYVNLGPLGSYGRQNDVSWALDVNKNCAMLKASFALAIILILDFFVTFILALLVAHHHRGDDNNERVVVKRHSSRYDNSRRRSRSRGGTAYRTSRDYDYRPSSGGRTRHRSSSRRQYYV